MRAVERPARSAGSAPARLAGGCGPSRPARPRRPRWHRRGGSRRGRGSPAARRAADRLVGRTVLAETDRVVGEEVDHRHLHQRREPDRWPRVVGEGQIGGPERPQLDPAGRCNAIMMSQPNLILPPEAPPRWVFASPCTTRTSYQYDRLVALSPHEVRLRPAPHSRTPVLSYSLSVLPTVALHQLAAGPVRQLRRALRLPRADARAELHGRPGGRHDGHQSVRFLHRAVRGELSVPLHRATAAGTGVLHPAGAGRPAGHSTGWRACGAT